MWLYKCFGFFVYLFTSVLFRTTRFRISGRDALCSEKKYVFAFWHGKQLVTGWCFSKELWAVTALVSASKDGQIAATWLKWLGFAVIRGSSSRRAVASLVHLIQALRAGKSVGVTPDGPKGPAGQAKPGVIYLASKTNTPIVPIGVACSRQWSAKSWDAFTIPKPFASVVMHFGTPMTFDKNVDINAACQQLAHAIDAAEVQAASMLERH